MIRSEKITEKNAEVWYFTLSRRENAVKGKYNSAYQRWL